jgi:hypothetical protein
MEEIGNFIGSFFRITIKEKGYGLRCSFLTEEGEEGYVILKKGKEGWNKKPIFNSPYLITESNMNGVIQIIDLRYKLDESDYEKIRGILYGMVMDVMNEYLDPRQ